MQRTVANVFAFEATEQLQQMLLCVESYLSWRWSTISYLVRNAEISAVVRKVAYHTHFEEYGTGKCVLICTYFESAIVCNLYAFQGFACVPAVRPIISVIAELSAVRSDLFDAPLARDGLILRQPLKENSILSSRLHF